MGCHVHIPGDGLPNMTNYTKWYKWCHHSVATEKVRLSKSKDGTNTQCPFPNSLGNVLVTWTLVILNDTAREPKVKLHSDNWKVDLNRWLSISWMDQNLYMYIKHYKNSKKPVKTCNQNITCHLNRKGSSTIHCTYSVAEVHYLNERCSQLLVRFVYILINNDMIKHSTLWGWKIERASNNLYQ